MCEFEFICCIVNRGHGSRALHCAKLHGVRGGTIFLAKGTVKSKLLDILDIHDDLKEAVIMVCEKEIAKTALAALSKELKFEKPHHGIGFSHSLKSFIGTRCYEHAKPTENTLEVGHVYNLIYTVVEKGLAEDVVETAQAAGARGGTIVNARGSSINETATLFAMPIEPEKEIVMIIAKDTITDAIVLAIRERLRLDQSGHGVLFVVGLNDVYGLHG